MHLRSSVWCVQDRPADYILTLLDGGPSLNYRPTLELARETVKYTDHNIAATSSHGSINHQH